MVRIYRHKTDIQVEHRTIEALMSTSPTESEKEQKKGQCNPPLLHIPLSNVILDELHLMLRITDVLTRNLILAAVADEAEADNEEDTDAMDLDELERPMIIKLIEKFEVVGYHLKFIQKRMGNMNLHHWWQMTKRNYFRYCQIKYRSANQKSLQML